MLNPKIYTLHLHSTSAIVNANNFTFNILNLFGDVDISKNYYCVVSNVQIQGLTNPGNEYRCIVIKTTSFNIMNSFYSKTLSRSNILSINKIEHDTNVHYVSQGDRTQNNEYGSGIRSGNQLFNNNNITLRFENIDDGPIGFESEPYSRFLITLNFIEVL